MCVIKAGTKEELESVKRLIDYGDQQNDYDKLHPFFQNAVDKVVYDLAEGKEFAGYNYGQVMQWFKSTSNSKVNQNKVVTQLNTYNLIYIWGENEDKDYQAYFNRHLDRFRKETKSMKEDSNLNRAICLMCDYLLISPDLIFKGKGEIYSIEEKYEESISEEFVKGVNDDDFSTKKVFQEYAKHIGVPEDEVFITEYAMISKQGAYMGLKYGEKNSDKENNGKKKAVDDLIDRLLFIQDHKMMLGYPCSECSLCAGGCER